jgi:L-lactate dehydrogenase
MPQVNIFMKDKKKVTIIGCGKVGMTSAFSIFLQGLANEIVLFGRKIDEIQGEALDLEHGMSFVTATQVKATDKYEDIANSDIVIITAGAAQKPGETRLDLAEKNIAIVSAIIPEVVKHAPDAVIVIVSNPVDIVTYKACQLANLPKGRVFGSGTILDTSRFRFHLSEFLHVSPRSIHAYILGEHGDSSFPVIDHANIGGQNLVDFPGFSKEQANKAFEKAKNAAYTIIQAKGATYYAIAIVVANLVKTILSDAKTVLPVSIPLHGQYGHNSVSISVPCIIGRNGVEKIIETKLSYEEKEKLARSVETIKAHL